MINNLQSILTQDHLCTESPIYLVYSKLPVCVDRDFDYDDIVYIKDNDDDYPELSFEEFKELERAYGDATDYRRVEVDCEGNQVDYPMPEDPCSGGEFNPDEWKERFVKYIDKFEQAFFIRKNAEDFIESQSHRLNNPRIYVESAYRNPEWQQIRELLIDKARIESEDVTA